MLLSGSERQFQRSSSALTAGGRRESEGAASSGQPNHYSQAATARYLIMRKATKKSLKVRHTTDIFILNVGSKSGCVHLWCQARVFSMPHRADGNRKQYVTQLTTT